jgi:hypothetical protein
LQPWIEREKAEHIKRAVAMGKRGYERIDRMWDENALLEVRDESLAATTLEKHDAIIRRNLGMNGTGDSSGSLSLNVLASRCGRTRIAIDQQPNQTPAQDPPQESFLCARPPARGYTPNHFFEVRLARVG